MVDLWRLDKDKVTFKAIEKHRYGLREIVSKHLKLIYDFGDFKIVIRFRQNFKEL